MKTRVLFFCFIAFILSPHGTEALAQWSVIPQLKYTNIKCLLVTDDSTIFVAGDNWTFLRSTDNGTTWTNVMKGIQADTILSIGKGGGYIFAGTNGVSSIYRSSNNGDSWRAANQGIPSLAQVNALTWVDSVVYTATNYGVFSSTDYGNSWTVDTAGLRLDSPYPGQLGGIAGITSVGSKLYAIKSMWGGVYTTSSGTIAWVPIGLDTVWGFAMASIDTNVFAGTPRGVYLYSGSGTTWLPRSNGLPGDFPSCILTAMDTLLFVYTGYWNNKGAYMSSDLGVTWRQINDSVFTGKTIHSMVATKTFLIAGTERGAWRLPIADLITSVKNDGSQLPANFTLSQNFPNPFNPTTHFRFTIADFPQGIPSERFVTLAVFDLLGREVAVLVDEEKAPGSYSVQWDATNFPSGVYFYQLKAGSFVETKKLLLMK